LPYNLTKRINKSDYAGDVGYNCTVILTLTLTGDERIKLCDSSSQYF